MIKTFEQFTQSERDTEEMYTPEEYKAVYNIVKKYFNRFQEEVDVDIETFIHSSDPDCCRDKTDFIDVFDLYDELNVCHNCGKFIVDDDFLGVGGCESYCSIDCFDEKYPHKYDDFVERGEITKGWYEKIEPEEQPDERSPDELKGYSWTHGI
jgi:hypothetical protein